MRAEVARSERIDREMERKGGGERRRGKKREGERDEVEEKRKAEVRIDVGETAGGTDADGRPEDGVPVQTIRVQGPRLVLEVSRRLVLVLRSRWVTGLAGPAVATYARVRIGSAVAHHDAAHTRT